MSKVVSLQAVKKVIIFTIGIHEILKDSLGPVPVAAKPMRPPWRDASMMSCATSDQNGAAVSGVALSDNHIPGGTVVGTTLGTVIRPVVSVSWLVEPNVPIYWVASRDGGAAHQIPTSTTAAADHPRLHSELSTLAPPFIPEGIPSGKPSSRQLHHGSSLGSPASQRPHRPTRSHSHAESFQSLVSQKEGGAVGVSAAPVEKPAMRPSSPVRIWSRKLGKEGASTRESRDSYNRTARGTGGGRDLQVAASESALGHYIPALESIAEGLGPNDEHELRSSACESAGDVKTGDIKLGSNVMDPPKDDALPDRQAADASSLSSAVSFPQTSVKSMKYPSKQTRSPVASPSGKTVDITKLAVVDKSKPNPQESTHSQAPPRIAKPVAQPQETSSAHSWASLSRHPAQEWKVVSHYKKGARRIPIRPSHSNIEGPDKINLSSSPRSPDKQQKSSQTSQAKPLESLQSQDPQYTSIESGLISGNMKEDYGPQVGMKNGKTDQDVNNQCFVSKGIQFEQSDHLDSLKVTSGNQGRGNQPKPKKKKKKKPNIKSGQSSNLGKLNDSWEDDLKEFIPSADIKENQIDKTKNTNNKISKLKGEKKAMINSKTMGLNESKFSLGVNKVIDLQLEDPPKQPLAAEGCVERIFEELFTIKEGNKLKVIEDSWKDFSHKPPFKDSRRTHLVNVWDQKTIRLWEKNKLDLNFMHHLCKHLRLNEGENHLRLKRLEDELFKRIVFYGTQEKDLMLRVYKVLVERMDEYEGFRRMVTLSKQVAQEMISRMKTHVQNLKIDPSLFENSKSGEYEKIFDIFGYYGLNQDLEDTRGYYSSHPINVSHPFPLFSLKYPELGTCKSEIYSHICGENEYRSRTSPRIHFTSQEFIKLIEGSTYGQVSQSEDLHQSLSSNGLNLNRLSTVVLILGLEEKEGLKLEEIPDDLVYYMSKVLFKILSPNKYNFLPWDATAEREWIYKHYKKEYPIKFKNLTSRLKSINPIQIIKDPKLCKAFYSEAEIKEIGSVSGSLDEIDSKSKCLETDHEILDVESEAPELIAYMLEGFEYSLFMSISWSNM
ncbi:hypothetical protein PGT21_035667 [Puccinia graminis f. sp. tritici]|uniref:Uncharacterized protein n=1 Tax=Puccinia graminis f. sp. tritici TaxID=56615 RepID=A0A5B0P0N5_PUCGR|nr:hypothetical protein PGT21_035667 [Puccinia graminis f. sp. tritici]KAA1121380.1 hypothetical protein PGTUg99_017276 [Puccinia graminis f. sp. tritici]